MKLTRAALGMIYESCAGHCYYCGIVIPPFGDWEVDHMKPREKGGEDLFYNLVAACRHCNRSKGGRTVEEYKQAIKERALKNLSTALQALLPLDFGASSPYYELMQKIKECEESIPALNITFYGELYQIPRQDNPAFLSEFELSMLDPSLDDDEVLSCDESPM